VSRVPEPDRPLPPEACLPWLADVPLDIPAAPPTLNAHYNNTNDRGEVVEIPPDSDTLERWDRYVTRDWRSGRRRRRSPEPSNPSTRAFSLPTSNCRAAMMPMTCSSALDCSIHAPTRHSVYTDTSSRFVRSCRLIIRAAALTLRPSAEFVSLRTETDFLPAADRGPDSSRNLMTCRLGS